VAWVGVFGWGSPTSPQHLCTSHSYSDSITGIAVLRVQYQLLDSHQSDASLIHIILFLGGTKGCYTLGVGGLGLRSEVMTVIDPPARA
jgi:hypothetical protein